MHFIRGSGLNLHRYIILIPERPPGILRAAFFTIHATSRQSNRHLPHPHRAGAGFLSVDVDPHRPDCWLRQLNG
jgi:hypothetical protein